MCRGEDKNRWRPRLMRVEPVEARCLFYGGLSPSPFAAGYYINSAKKSIHKTKHAAAPRYLCNKSLQMPK
jgi:hypothetical protein